MQQRTTGKVKEANNVIDRIFYLLPKNDVAKLKDIIIRSHN